MNKNRMVSKDGKVVISGAFFRCPKCTTLKEGSEFGFRLSNGKVINQSYCSTCRREASRKSEAEEKFNNDWKPR